MQRRRPERRLGTEGWDRSFVALFEVLGVRPEQTAAAVQAQWARAPVKVGRRGCAKVAPTLVTVAAVGTEMRFRVCVTGAVVVGL